MSIDMVGVTISFSKSSMKPKSITQNIQSDNFIRLFLSQVLNLGDASFIIRQEKYEDCKLKQEQGEFLPHIRIPKDIWLNDELSIKEIKVKTLMLQELNQLMDNELNRSNNLQKIDDASLEYYEKLFSAYGFYEIIDSSGPIDDSTLTLHEEQEEDNNYPSNLFYDDKTNTNTNKHNSMMSINSRNSNTNRSSNRFSISSRDKIRFPNVLNTKELNTQPGIYQSVTPPEEDLNIKQQPLNSLLAKSKLYNKIRRHRESVSSTSSNVSHISNYSHRNSISTTNTTNSSITRRRTSNAEGSDTKRYFPRTSQDYSTEMFSPIKKQENQKNKYSYYIQCEKLLDLTKTLLLMDCDSENVTKLLRFIKKKVLKFIILDIQQMIIENARNKAYGNFNGC